MTFDIAELHSWVKLNLDRDTFQGYVNNDSSHVHSDGEFVTLEADEVQHCDEGLIVTVRKQLYYLWNTFKR